MNLLYTSPALLSPLWTCCTEAQQLYPLSEPVANKPSAFIHSLNLLHTSPATLPTLWTCCKQARYFYPLFEPVAHKPSSFTHSLNLFYTSPVLLSPLWACYKFSRSHPFYKQLYISVKKIRTISKLVSAMFPSPLTQSCRTARHVSTSRPIRLPTSTSTKVILPPHLLCISYKKCTK